MPAPRVQAARNEIMSENKTPCKASLTQGCKKNRFLIDTINLFSGDRSGHMARYAFTHAQNPQDKARGAEYWEKFIDTAPNYYLYREERNLIRSAAKKIITSLPDNVSFVELGPGEEHAVREKTLSLLRAFNNAAATTSGKKQIVDYTALDISPSFANDAAKTVTGSINVPSSEVVSDFTEDNLTVPVQGCPVMLVFGGTLLNASSVKGYKPEYALQSYLDNIRDIVGPDGYVVITQDTNTDQKSLMKAYKHRMCEKAALSIMHRMERDLDTTNFCGDDFRHEIKWDPARSLLTLNAVSKVDKQIKIGGVPFNLRKNEKYPLVNAFKYSTDHFKKVADDAGFEIIDTLSNNKENRIALHIMRVKQPAP